ncbi:DNA-binding NarL/FixJ family response regulator [Actinomadura luteofluorescens]|uniref:DNA-binding NarL/FixJ family response regulator n=2 Tax=Actinomadura luteofluorescens TaxID=46163 RepID=A0A7Y9EP76_9ACTN|nr:AAA family ATPase [Actinomadura luteofluorescens]NYD51386.1 DNA-binding NarL/FixJ family response regulator [Actinomadura luteofluorescens]
MEGRTGHDNGAAPSGVPLVGRRDVLRVFEESLDATAADAFRFLALVGEPGAGKTRLLTELSNAAEARKLATLAGRASEFEQEMPFGAVVDALDDHLEDHAGDLGRGTVRLLGPVFPALAASLSDGEDAGPPGSAPVATPVARYQLYRAVRRLLEEVAAPSGLVLILDDVHWADNATIELLDHLVRHPPRARVLIAVAYRPAQASARLAALVQASLRDEGGHRLTVKPLTQAEVAEMLGPGVSGARCSELYRASGGNPFYLEALARTREPLAAGYAEGELPPAVRAALQLELSGLSPDALLIAQSAAVAADEFAPPLAAVAAEVSERVALAALDELVARDIVRPRAERFRFRHPLVRHAAYRSAAAGWRLAAHGRIAAYLTEIGAPAAFRARHLERSARVGDRAAVATLVEAARAFATQAPSTAAHWLKVALGLMPATDDAGAAGGDPAQPSRLALMMELAQVQTVGGHLIEGRETARSVLKMLPLDAYEQRARAARLAALMERQLDRPNEARTLLLDELRRMPDPRSPAAVPLRMRLIAERMMRIDFRAAQAVLDLMPDSSEDWEPSLELAVAAFRPMPALAAGRIEDTLRYLAAADRLVDAAPDEHLAEWMDAIAWLCWAETFMGRFRPAARRFERAVDVARATGQLYVVPTLMAGLTRAYGMLGRLEEAAVVAEEAVEEARLLHSGQQLVFALTQQSLVAGWSGDEESALRHAEEAIESGAGVGEWWGSMARYARAMALIGLGRLEEGAEAVDATVKGPLDQRTHLSLSEVMAGVEAGRGRAAAAQKWVERGEHYIIPGLEAHNGLAQLARAHVLQLTDAAAAAREALAAAEMFEEAGHRIDAGRARMRAGQAHAGSGERAAAREQLRLAAEIFAGCGARSLHAQAVREQRRIGVRVPARGGGRETGLPGGLSKREYEVASLVVEGCTNSQIAERLFVSIRTVETHLSHIFAKFGVNSRVGVVNALSRQDPDAPGAG